jgi:hypothetical protein
VFMLLTRITVPTELQWRVLFYSIVALGCR